MNASNNGSGAGVAAFFDNVDLIVRDALIGSHSDKIAPDAQRALRRIADKLSAGPEARATIESAMALPGWLRDLAVNHLNGEAYVMAVNKADELEAIFGPAPPATDAPEGRAESFKLAALPLIQWLAENCHPHHSVIVTSTNAELLEGQITTGEITDHLRG
jgi:hypothetical protein